MLMLLAIPKDMKEKERDVVIPLMIRGFKDAATEAGTSVQGGQTIFNPWLMMGGVATAVCSQREFIMPDNSQIGDVLVLTKPLGTQVKFNFFQRIFIHFFKSPFIFFLFLRSPFNFFLFFKVAVNAYQWLNSNSERWEKIQSVISKEETKKAYFRAMYSMARLNRIGTIQIIAIITKIFIKKFD